MDWTTFDISHTDKSYTYIYGIAVKNGMYLYSMILYNMY